MSDAMNATLHLIFRCDASPAMGTGHVMRCLTLAEVWRDDFDGTASFCCAELSGSLEQRIKDAGHSIVWLGDGHDFVDNGNGIAEVSVLQNAMAVVIDGYQFDRAYREPLLSAAVKVATFRDAGSETYGADLVIDASPAAVIPANDDSDKTVQALGPVYALVAPSILAAKKLSVAPQGILITFGGSDPHGLSMPVAEAIRSHLSDVPLHIVLGGSVKNVGNVTRKLARIPNVTVSHDVRSLGPAIVGAQMVVTAAGSSLFEIAALARPMILVITEDNQSELGTLDWAKIIDVRNNPKATAMIAAMAVDLFQNTAEMSAISEWAARTIDGNGAHRVLSKIKRLKEL